MLHTTPMLAISLLGPPRLERDGQRVELDTRKALALLAYLAVQRECFSRDKLATLFWPEYDQERAYANLRRVLWSLNKTLGEGWFAADHEHIQLVDQPQIWVDVTVFHHHLAECRRHGHRADDVCPACLKPLAQAAALMRGDFLDGLSLRDSPTFDEWQRLQTESLRHEISAVLARLVEGFNRSGAFEQALPYAQRWVALDPLYELAQRNLMLTYAWSGRYTDAFHQYQQCEQLLHEEMGASPEVATTQLFVAIRHRHVPPPPQAREAVQRVGVFQDVEDRTQR